VLHDFSAMSYHCLLLVDVSILLAAFDVIKHPLAQNSYYMDMSHKCLGQLASSHDVEMQISESLGGNSALQARTVPLPGFEEGGSCMLCRLKCGGSGGNERLKENGASITELIGVANRIFSSNKGKEARDICNKLTNTLHQFSEKSHLSFLKDVTEAEVYDHFKYDHQRVRKPVVRDTVIRALMTMLETSLSTCCEMGEEGSLTLSRSDTILALNIIDRLHKMASIKENDT